MKPLRSLCLCLLILGLAACSQDLAPDPAVLETTAVIETISQTSNPCFSGENFFAQTFTPTVSGFLTKITVYHAGPGVLTQQISFYEGAGPITSPIYVQPVTWTDFGPQEVMLDTPLPVVAGQTYTYYPQGAFLKSACQTNSTDLYTGGERWIGPRATFSDSWQTYRAWATSSGFNPAIYDSDLAFVIVIEDSVDSTAPTLTVPADVTLEAPADTSPATTGSATATDDTDPNPSISFRDLVTPGSCDANYTISRTWIATDNNGNVSSKVQTITVQDTTDPSLSVPEDVTVIEGESTDPADTGVATASDSASGVTVSYSDVVVNGNDIERTWTATDDCGNVSSEVQTITVLTAQEALAQLIDEVEALGLRKGIETSLVKKLSNAIRNLDDGLTGEAVEKLESFIDELMAQRGKKVDAADADALIEAARRILAVL